LTACSTPSPRSAGSSDWSGLNPRDLSDGLRLGNFFLPDRLPDRGVQFLRRRALFFFRFALLLFFFLFPSGQFLLILLKMIIRFAQWSFLFDRLSGSHARPPLEFAVGLWRNSLEYERDNMDAEQSTAAVWLVTAVHLGRETFSLRPTSGRQRLWRLPGRRHRDGRGRLGIREPRPGAAAFPSGFRSVAI